MIRINIKAPFLGDRYLRVFHPSCEETIENLTKLGIPIDMERNTRLRLDSSGYAETHLSTIIQVKSDTKLAELQIHEIETQIRKLIANSFYSSNDWGEITFEFSVATFSF